MEKLRFCDIDRAPACSGVYAWYCQHRLATFDVDKCIEAVHSQTTTNGKEHEVRVFLEKRIFAHFAESGYNVRLFGRLKPRYEGTVPHIPSVSDPLVSRLAAEPERIRVLASVLKETVPSFSSPIYIGSARVLRSRLKSHVKLIRHYREELPPEPVQRGNDFLSDDACHSFAHEVAVLRRFDPNNLWVFLLRMELEEETTYDIENILNRINFPLCGRN